MITIADILIAGAEAKGIKTDTAGFKTLLSDKSLAIEVTPDGLHDAISGMKSIEGMVSVEELMKNPQAVNPGLYKKISGIAFGHLQSKQDAAVKELMKDDPDGLEEWNSETDAARRIHILNNIIKKQMSASGGGKGDEVTKKLKEELDTLKRTASDEKKTLIEEYKKDISERDKKLILKALENLVHGGSVVKLNTTLPGINEVVSMRLKNLCNSYLIKEKDDGTMGLFDKLIPDSVATDSKTGKELSVNDLLLATFPEEFRNTKPAGGGGGNGGGGNGGAGGGVAKDPRFSKARTQAGIGE